MIISFRAVEADFNNDIQEIFCNIDRKISILTKRKLDSIRYDIKICVDNTIVKDLSRYKLILFDKIKSNKCLEDYSLEDIINRIKKLLNKI